MSGLATITVAGNVVADAERRDAGTNGLTSFRVAANVRRGREDVAMFFACTLWGRHGDAVRPYLTKGTQVTVSGDFAVREYQANSGESRQSLEINVQSLALQGSRRDSHGGSRDDGPPPPGDDYGPPAGGGGGFGDDDIPF